MSSISALADMHLGNLLRIEIRDDAGDIEAGWWDLWHRDPHATPFQSPAWLLPWRRHFADGGNAILSFWEKNRLVGLLPLFEHEGRLLPWGAGTSDWLDGIFDPALDPGALSQGVAALRRPVDLFQLRAGSPLLGMPTPEGWREQARAAESCAILSLPMQPSKKMAQNLRYYRRRAARAGIGEAGRGSAGDIDRLAELHTRRWNGRDEAGIFADPRMLGSLREALAALEAAGLLRLYILKDGAETLAALCAFGAKGRSYYYVGGFDPEHAALGLGTILVGHAIEEAQREGHRSFDFLRGREPYKYHWGAVDRPTHARQFIPPEGESRR